MAGDFDYRMGKIEMDFLELARGRFGEGQVIINWSPEQEKVIPDEIRDPIEQEIIQKEKEAKEQGKLFFDGPLVGCRGFEVKDGTMVFDTVPTSYFKYSGTNQSLDKEMSEGWTIRQRYITNPYDFRDVLADPIGVSTFLITEDNKGFFAKRSVKLSTYPSKNGILPAGYMHPEKDLIDGMPNPFRTAEREAKEELGLEGKLEVELTGFGRPKDTMHSELYGTFRTEMTAREVMDKLKESKKAVKTFDFGPDEHEAVYFREFAPESIITRENFGDANDGWVLAHAIAPINALINEYGLKRVKRLCENI